MSKPNESKKEGLVPSLEKDGFSLICGPANFGVRNLSLRVEVQSDFFTAEYGEVSTKDGTIVAAANLAEGLTVETRVESIAGSDAVTIRHTLRNHRTEGLRVDSAATGQFTASAAVLHGHGNWLGWDLRYAHTDNVRTERYPHCQMEYPYYRMLPVEKVRLGAGEDQPFPALFLKDQRGKAGLVIAAASQDVNFSVFELRKKAMVNEGIFAEFAIVHDPGRNGGFLIPAGGELVLDGLYFQIVGDLPIEDAFKDYVEYVSTTAVFRGPRTPILGEAFHCTWNYGVFADQCEKSLLPTARFMSENVPNIKWFLVDAGYLMGDIDTTFLDRFYPDPNQFVSSDKWSQGMRGFTDELRRLGLRPGLWWSPTVSLKTELYRDHPDWFMRRRDGEPYRIGEANGFLDFSNPAALDYLDRTLAVILGEWGMDACKMDFWSQNFESRDLVFHDPSLTSVQMRNRFLGVVRSHLPEDGVFMTCVATGMGNPFIGRWADTYRNTIDIGVGNWHEQVNNCIWSLPTLGIEGRLTFLLNNDSVGYMPDHPDHENEFRFIWSYINMGLLETGGRMEGWPEKWVGAMRQVTQRCDRGYRVQCPDDRAFTGVPLPEALFVDFPPESPTAKSGVRQAVALFNWSDEPKIISVLRSRLGHAGPVSAREFFTGQPERLEGEFLTKRLEGRSAVLLDVLIE